eukprot:gene4013-7569_t
MELDKVDEKRALSRLGEVRHMQKAFVRMVRNMRELRNYMPQSLMASHGADEEEELE